MDLMDVHFQGITLIKLKLGMPHKCYFSNMPRFIFFAILSKIMRMINRINRRYEDC